jgi:hypothetical protein
MAATPAAMRISKINNHFQYFFILGASVFLNWFKRISTDACEGCVNAS